MLEPDFNLEGDLAHEEATGTIVFPVDCVTDAQRIAHLEYRERYLRALVARAQAQDETSPELLAAIVRTEQALQRARSAGAQQN